jgi:hypothetical protein
MKIREIYEKLEKISAENKTNIFIKCGSDEEVKIVLSVLKNISINTNQISRRKDSNLIIIGHSPKPHLQAALKEYLKNFQEEEVTTQEDADALVEKINKEIANKQKINDAIKESSKKFPQELRCYQNSSPLFFHPVWYGYFCLSISGLNTLLDSGSFDFSKGLDLKGDNDKAKEAYDAMLTLLLQNKSLKEMDEKFIISVLDKYIPIAFEFSGFSRHHCGSS